MPLNKEKAYSCDAGRPAGEGKGPLGPQEKSHAAQNGLPERGKGPRALENGNALHERNGLSSHGLHRSTFGDGELNCRVRHGTG